MDNQLMEILYKLSKIDYDIFVQSFKIILAYFMPQKVISTYRLHKDFKPKDISKVSVPPELKQKYNTVEINQVASKKLREATLEFANLMVETFPSSALTNFYNNINDAKIKRNNGILIFLASGMFSAKSNKISVASVSSIYHELFHMASSYYDEDSKLSYVGFRQHHSVLKSNRIDIGSGINEGYTQLLTERYFGEKHNVSSVYDLEVSIADKLEKIVGQEKMETLYLNANLLGLINELTKYASEEAIMKFIAGVDLLNMYSNELFIFKNAKVKKSIENVYGFLLKTYLVKLKQQLDSEVIGVNEFLQQATQFTQSLGTNIKISGRKYEILTLDNLLEIWQSITDIPQLSTDIQDIDDSLSR